MSFANTDADYALIIGEALIDLVIKQGDPGEPAAHPGGSPLNVALTLGRLGQSVELATWLAKDAYGQLIVDHLNESNVVLVDGSCDSAQTATALATLDSSGAATYTFDINWEMPDGFTVPPNAAFVHTSSIGSILLPGAVDALAAIKSAKATSLVSYDPNIRPTIMGDLSTVKPFVEEYVKVVDLVKVSDEDLEWLYPSVPLDEIVANWFALGDAQIIIVTCGSAGPTLWSRSGITFSKPPADVTVVDTVGAGDSFMGALIDALWRRGITYRQGAARLGTLSEAELDELLDEANCVAGVTVSRAGANPPWLRELNR